MKILCDMVKTRPERSGYKKILYEQHLERVKNSKPVVDTGPPTVYPYGNRWKIKAQNEQRKIEIENQLMINRIVNNNDKNIDNELDTYIEDYAYFKRKMAIQKNIFDTNLINQQNKKLVNRLCNARSCYNRKEWENDYQKHKKIIKNMSLYPEQYTIDYSTS
jgi:hypothetical protein